jgi:hypothetical protein
MKVFGLALDEDSQVPVLVLKDMGEQKVLPIWIGAMEAMAISLALNKVELPRPMTHDLLLNILNTMGASLKSVDVLALKDGTYYAEIEAQQGESTYRIDSRPSDAVALALRADVPILVHEDVIDQAALDEESQPTPVINTEDADKWTEMLEKLNPKSTKYKM